MRSRSLVEGRLEEHLAATFPGDALPAPEEVRSGTIAGVVGPEGEEGRELARKNADRHRWIGTAGSPGPGARSGPWRGGATSAWRTSG
jgi:hypothetical protein